MNLQIILVTEDMEDRLLVLDVMLQYLLSPCACVTMKHKRY